MIRVFVEPSSGGRVELPDEERHHLIRVRRCREGDVFLGFHAREGWLRCRLTRGPAGYVGEVLGPEGVDRESPLRVTLAQALAKRERFEWVLQKSVELGVTEIVPLITHRSELKLVERQREKRLTRWRKIVREAMKQSGRGQLPGLGEPVELKTCLAGELPEVRLFLDESGSRTLREWITGRPPPSSCLLVVGPEGGWDDRDRDLLVAADCTPVKLGPRIMRTETAPIAGLAVLQHVWGDL